MKKRIVAFLLAASMIATNCAQDISVVSAAELPTDNVVVETELSEDETETEPEADLIVDASQTPQVEEEIDGVDELDTDISDLEATTEEAVEAEETEVTEAPATEGTETEEIETEVTEETEEAEEKESLFELLKENVKKLFAGSELTYKDFTEDTVVGSFTFGTDIKADSVYSESRGYGFSKVEFPNEAKGWENNIFYPREEVVTSADASYVKAAEGSLAIDSKVWTETDSTGFGVYTYENTATFDYDLANADYKVEVMFANPTTAAYTAYVEAEDITKASDISVAAGGTAKAEFTAVLVDGKLNLKFLAASAAKDASAATTQTVYVSSVKITRLATNSAREDGKPTVFIASDSTVQSYDSYYYPQTGWGQVLAEFFGDGDYEEVTSASCGYGQAKTYEVSNAVIENRAIGGRSSSSFIIEGKLDDLLEDVRPGDFLLVQWGHNDSTYSRPNRYVSPEDFEKWMQYYVDGAIQRGATPILVTPVARYSYTTDAEGNLISYASNFEAYRQVMIKMSKEQGIALVDLTQRSIDVANSFGIDGGKSLWLYTNAGDYPGGAYAGGSTDSTHLQWYGAYKFAQCVATGIVEAGNSEVYTNENNASTENKAALAALAQLVDLRAATTKPNKITGLTLGTVGASSAAMSWTADDESEMYHIYRAEVASAEEGAAYQFKEEDKKYSVSRNAKYTDTGCESGKTYVYAVRGYNSLGLGEFSDTIVVTTKSAGYRFDFNYNNSTTQAGWTGINQNQMYDAAVGYGWITAPNNGRSRGNNGTVSDDLADMAGDFCLGAGEFAVDIPNGDYEITIYAADLLSGTSSIKPSYDAEGAAFGSISCKQSLGSVTGTVRITDGQLNIVVGGSQQYINGMTITEILKAPTSLNETEAAVSGSTYTALLPFVGVDEAAGYNYYIKGTTDKEFKLERTFDSAKYALGVTEYGAISVNLGENYEYYVTCYTSDGTESAPSNTITVTAQLDVAKPAAPQNVVCVDPSKDAEDVKNSITIKWDASKVENSTYPVLKYIIYRSDKAEDAKGFKGFEKVGESTTTTFTDNSEGLATNIHYYYKVCASNAGGAGELSKACETPITGQLVAVAQETLTDRALTAVKLSDTVKAIGTDGKEITEGVYLSWRAFEEEFDAKNNLTTTFTVKVNGTAVQSDLKTTNVVLTNVPENATFTVEGSADKSVNGGLKVIETKAWDNQYIEMQLYKPADETMPDGSTCNFTANDMSVGDVDADGQLELIVKWYPSNAKDNSGSGYTGKTFLDTYDINWNSGAVVLLSRIDLGINIRSGAHYTQFQVWDFDADGKAEIAAKTADGSTIYKSTDGTDATLTLVGYVGACSTEDLPTNVVSNKNDYRNTNGYVLSGPEYFTMFNPEDGTILDTVEYIPGRGTVSKWGDAYGNRVDRFLSATAYLDGVHPFAVMCRGYYTRTALTAYGTRDTNGDGIGDEIYTYWAYDTDNGDGPEGQGHHNLTVGDVDNDGKDEILYGSSCYDHDGTLKYSTDLGHGDAMHLSDWVSWNDGMELMTVHEEWNKTYQVEIHDAETGEIIIGYPVKDTDVGRGVASDIDPTSKGAEFWASSGPSGEGTGEWDSIDSSVIGTENSSTTAWDVLSLGSTPAVNATLYWDGDLLAEIQDHVFNNKNGNYYPVSTFISKWNYQENKQEKILSTDEIFTSNGTKGNLGLIADLTGDWRDEFIARCSADDSKIRLYTTTYETNYVIPCALDDLQYREGVAWENVGYNQPTHTSYLVSKGLVTAQLSVDENATTTNSVTINFTPANDGDLYGHEITAYEIYRDGKLIKTIDKKDLTIVSGSEEEEEELVPPVAPEKISYKFDFGAGAVAEGYTQVKADALYNAETGYGFSALDGLSNKSYSAWNDDENAALYNDSVLGWIANGSVEFKVDIPNGNYDVTFTIANGSGAAYDLVTAEAVAFTDVRRGNSDIQATSETKTVEVTDGQLNIVNTVSKNGYAALYFTGIMVEESDASFAARQAAYEKALEEYNAAINKGEVDDPTYGVVRAEHKFDFGGVDGKNASKVGPTMEGFTAVTSKDAAYEDSENGYGFTKDSLSGITYRYYAGGTTTFDTEYDSSYAALFDDCAMGWNSDVVFKTNLPNGSYDVTLLTSHVSGTAKNILYVQDLENQVARYADKNTAHVTKAANIKVEDGVLTVKATLDPTYTGAVILCGLQIEETEASYQARIAEAKAAYEAEQVPADLVYSYTDTGLKSDITYSYQIAAVVDRQTSYMSRAVEATTLVQIKSVKEFSLPDLVQGTAFEESVAELLPATVIVLDQDGKEVETKITWDVSKLNIDKVGEYDVIGTVRGLADPIKKTVKVIANEIKGYAPISEVNVIQGSASADLPKMVTVEYTNGKSEDISVTWNTEALDLNTIDTYVLEGTLATEVAGLEEKPTVTVNVVGDYPVSVATTSIEIALGEAIIPALPETVVAKMASGKSEKVAVTWKTEGLDTIDTSKVGNSIIHGTVEGLDADVLCDVYFNYPALYKFDLGINKDVCADGWTTLTVNAKGGTKTIAQLGLEYTEEKGYGFTNGEAVVQGRTESVAGLGLYPTNVATDFALMAGQSFVVDVPNGDYLVQVMTNCGIGSTSATVDVEGTSQSFNANKSFTVKDYTVRVKDGQLTVFVQNKSTPRIGAIVVRKIATYEFKEFTEIPAVDVIVGSASVDLPSKVTVEYTNGKSEEENVTWNTEDLDLNTIDTYVLEGTLEAEVVGLPAKPTFTVNVIKDYPVFVGKTSVEIALGEAIIPALPETVVAKMASGKIEDVAVTWKTEELDDIDTSKVGIYTVKGTVEDFEEDVLCDVYVNYPVMYKFDFGIDEKNSANGWTALTVNAEGKEKTFEELDLVYTEGKGYGFVNGSAIVEGRTESVEGIGLYPTNVTSDFVFMTGQTFVVDVPNGYYQVQLMTNCGIGSTSATVDVEGTSQSFDADKSFTVKDYTVRVKDGQITITDKSELARIGAIIVRKISAWEFKAYTEIPAVDVIVGSASVDLPSKVTVEYTNGKSEEENVTWNTEDLDLNTIDTYVLEGTLEAEVVGLPAKPTFTVNVIKDYPVFVGKTSVEIALGEAIIPALPETVVAKMASGKIEDVAVTWKTEELDDIDTSKVGIYTVKGTVEDFEEDVLCDVYFNYPVLYKFDFGIDEKNSADGWTALTVNAEGETKTLAELGLEYTTEKGYGFVDGSAVVEGRTESVEGLELVYPTKVTSDFAFMAGQTFVVDVPYYGDYMVQIMTNSGVESTSLTVDVEGTSESFSANAKTFKVNDYTVRVKDGQITITAMSENARIGAIIVREVFVPDEFWATGVEENKTYTGKAITMDNLVVHYGKRVLTAGQDYSVAYKNNVKVGTATITVTGKGNYAGSFTSSFDIVARDLSDAKITATDATAYNKTAVAVTYNGIKLKAGTDYEKVIEYAYDSDVYIGGELIHAKGDPVGAEDDISAGTILKATVTGRGNFTGTASATYRIAASIAKASVTVKPQSYTGAAVEPSKEDIVVKVGKTELVQGVDYTYECSNNLDASKKAVIKITGIGAYTGTITKNFVINPYALTEGENGSVSVTVVGTATYAAKAGAKPSIEVKANDNVLVEGKDYTVTYKNNKAKVGSTATVTITGKGNYSGKLAEKKFKIIAASLNPVATATDAISGDYTNTTIKVFAADGTVLKAGTDYSNTTIAYAYVKNTPVKDAEGKEVQREAGMTVVDGDFIPAGTEIRVTVEGIGNYTGTASATYRVAESIAKAKVTIEKQSYTGNKIEPNIVVTLGEKILDAKNDYDVTFTNNTKVGKKALATITGKGIYSGTISKTFEITKCPLAAEFVSVKQEVVYTPAGAKATVSVWANGTELKANKDYTVSYGKNKNVGKNTVTIKAGSKSNYSGSVTKEYTIVKDDLTSVTATDVVATGKKNLLKNYAPVVVAEATKVSSKEYALVYTYEKLTDDSEKKVGDPVSAEDIIPAGTEIKVTVAAKEDGNYSGEVSACFRCVEKTIASKDTKVTIPNQTFTGDPITLAEEKITVKVKVGKKYENLTAEDFRIVSCENNINKGTATITLRGVGSFGGIKKATFKIVQKAVNNTVVFDKNASNAKGTMKNKVGSKSIALTKNAFTRTGYTFDGWNTESDGSGKSYADKESYEFDSYGNVVTLYAQWKAVDYTITYKNVTFEEETVTNENPVTYTFADEVVLVDPVRKGYTFMGWYTNKNLNKKYKVEKIKAGSTGSKTFYAKWEKIETPEPATEN